MEIDTLAKTIATLLDSGNVRLLYDAIVICLLTAITKRLFVNKTKIDLAKKADPTPYIPFVYGLIVAFVHALVDKDVGSFAANALCGGALASSIYRIYASIFVDNVKNLCKDDVCELLYNCLLNLGDVRQKMLDGGLTMSQYISQVRLFADKSKEIFNANDSEEQRKEALTKLLGGLIDDQTIGKTLPVLYQSLEKLLSAKK